MKIKEFLKIREDLIKKNDELSQDCERLRKEERELSDRRKVLKNELIYYKNKKNIFLPCGHSKFIELQENAVLEELVTHASSHLSAKEAENSNIQKQLRNKIIALLANKFPETYKCSHKVSFIIGKCGHLFETECSLINLYKRGEKTIECFQHVEKLLPCGHMQLIECFKEMEIVVCKKC